MSEAQAQERPGPERPVGPPIDRPGGPLADRPAGPPGDRPFPSDRPMDRGPRPPRDDGLRVQLRPDESFEGMLSRFRRTVMNAGILREAKAHRFFVPKGEQIRLARKRAERKRAKRARREAARLARRP